VVLAVVGALVASPKDKLTGQEVDAVIDRERHLTFEVGPIGLMSSPLSRSQGNIDE
jgi:hypothetical protein